MRTFFRAGLFFATFMMVVMAFVQVGGRIAVSFLDDLEPQLNELLQAQGIELKGLQGNWRFLNPGARLERLTLPAGTLQGVAVQLDLLESLRRGHWVLSFARLEGSLTLVWADGRWQLKGMSDGGEAPFDVPALLWHSDQLWASLALTFERASTSTVLEVEGKSANRGGGHSGEATLRSGSCEKCSVVVRYDFRDAIPWVRKGSRRVVADGAMERMPLDVLLGLSDAAGSLRDIKVRWADHDGQGGGRASLSLADLRLAGSQGAALDMVFSLRNSDQIMRIFGERFSLAVGEREAELSDLLAQVDRSGIELYVPSLNIDEVAPVARDFSQGIKRVGRWLDALALSGNLERLRFGLRFGQPAGEARWFTAYEGHVTDFSMEPYKGAPRVRHGRARLFGTGRHIAAEVNSPEAYMHLAEVFDDGWALEDARGRLEMWLQPGQLALVGRNISAKLGETHVRGEFALAQPKARYDKHLSLLISADVAALPTGKSMIPANLNAELKRWLHDGPRAGRFSDIEFAYQGQIHTREGELGRRIAMSAQVIGGRLKYHPQWPEIEQVNGTLSVSGVRTNVQASNGSSLGVALGGSEITVLDNGASVDVSLAAQGDAQQLLAFVRSSPLQEQVAFISPEWHAAGPVRLHGDLQVPLSERAGFSEAKARITSQLNGVDLFIPEFRAQFNELEGALEFTTPHGLAARALVGRFWEHPVEASIRYDDRFVHFDVQGRLTDSRTFHVAAMEDPGLLAGELDFDASLSVAVSDQDVTELVASTDLVGMEVLAPTGFGKSVDEAAPSRVLLRFLDDYVTAGFNYKRVAGWLHLVDAPVRGSIGIDAPPPVLPEGEDAVLVSGFLPTLDVYEWTGAGESGLDLPFPWRVSGLSVDRLVIGEFEAAQAMVDGAKGADGLAFDVAGEHIAGHVMIPDAGPMDLNLDLLRVPETGEEDGSELESTVDPLSAELAAELPEAHVLVEKVFVGDEDYGRWEFDLTREDAGSVRFENLSATVKGIQLEAKEGLRWDGARSYFDGSLVMQDLAEVLPQWGYAPSLSSEEAGLVADVSWPGSPLNIALLGLSGDVAFSARDGRFLEMDAGGGALRILGLLNFSAIVKRLNLNFSDVVGKGLSFERVKTQVSLDQGVLDFVDPLSVSSTSSAFRIGGRVDLNSGVLDNEMVVTLPVTRGLPWYGVYVALANPLAGLGVLVGERVLRKPLQQMSSAKYVVRGTLEDPDVRFVELFSTRLKEAQEPEAPTEVSPETSLQVMPEEISGAGDETE